MTATIIPLPVIQIERFDQTVHVLVPLNRKHHARLCRYAREWNISPEEAAAAIIDQYFQSVRNR